MKIKGPLQYSKTKPECGDGEILVEIFADGSGDRHTRLLDQKLNSLSRAAKRILLDSKKGKGPGFLSEIFPPMPELNEATQSYPAGRGSKRKAPSVTSNPTLVLPDVETRLFANIQERLVDYFEEAKKGAPKPVLLRIWQHGEGDLFLMRLPGGEGNTPPPPPPQLPREGRWLATIKIHGDLTKDPYAFTVRKASGGNAGFV